MALYTDYVDETAWSRSNIDEIDYNSKRNALLATIPPAEIARTPFMFMKRQDLSTACVRLHLYEKIVEIPGSIVECGVNNGNGLCMFYHLASIYEPYNINRKIIGFDTFEGFPSVSSKDTSNFSKI